MLKNKLYSVIDIKHADDAIHAAIRLDEKHPVFKGHFPGQPVVPGVCEMQIVKEILTSVVQRKLQMLYADDIKFLQMIDPNLNNMLNVEIHYSIQEENKIELHANIFQENRICFKLNAAFTFSE